MFTNLSEKLYSMFSSVPFDTLVWVVCGTYAGIFLLSLLGCAFSKKIRAAEKRPFLSLTNAYSALVLAVFLIKQPFAQSVLVAVLFWVAGYILYGALRAASSGKKPAPQAQKEVLLSSMPVSLPKNMRAEVPAAKTNVRLEHAVSVTEKLLSKNLGKTDRMELEKLKNTLAVLQMKGALSPVESDILNENFNMLLKLMAKYNV